MVKFLKRAAAVLLAALSLFLLQRLLMPKYASGIVEGAFIQEYYDEPRKDFDVIFVGDCEVYENFSPAVLWEEYGISSYIRGSAQQLIWQSCCLLEETLSYDVPDVVIFNIQSLQYSEPQSEAYNRMTLDGMRWGPAKVKSIMASMTGEESFVEYLFPLLRYHSRWDELTAEDVEYMFRHPKVSHNGYYMRVDVKPAEDVPEGKPLADYRFGDNAWQWLDRMDELCREKGTQLLLIKAPSLYPAWYDQWEEQVEAYAEEHDLPYINFLELQEETGLDYSTDTYDAGLHMNLSGAEKLSRWLGKYLQENYDLEDRRGEEDLAACWDAKILDYNADRDAQLAALKTSGESSQNGGDSSGTDTPDSSAEGPEGPADGAAPVISGAQDLTAVAGGTISYRSGVSARDEEDGPLRFAVDTRDVNLAVPGTYTAVYRAKDSDGNTAEVSVTVTVTEAPPEEDPAGSGEAEDPAGSDEPEGEAIGEAPVDPERLTWVDQEATKILLTLIQPGMSPLDIAREIHAYVRSSVVYVGSSDKSNWVNGAYEGFSTRRGDCYTYYACSKVLLTKAGIPSVDMTRVGGTTHHFWQLVNTGKGWYHFDACPHPTGYAAPHDGFMMTEVEARQYTKDCKSRVNYYVYDYDHCPVAVVGMPKPDDGPPVDDNKNPSKEEKPAEADSSREEKPDASGGDRSEKPDAETGTGTEKPDTAGTGTQKPDAEGTGTGTGGTPAAGGNTAPGTGADTGTQTGTGTGTAEEKPTAPEEKPDAGGTGQTDAEQKPADSSTPSPEPEQGTGDGQQTPAGSQTEQNPAGSQPADEGEGQGGSGEKETPPG